MFVLAMPAQAEFTDASTLRLTGVSSTAQFYGAGAQSALRHCPVLTCGRSTCGMTAYGRGCGSPVVRCQVHLVPMMVPDVRVYLGICHGLSDNHL